MAVDRLSVTVPRDLGAALRKLAKVRRETISTIVSEAIAHQVRMAAMDELLAETGRRFGPVPDAMIAAAEAELLAARSRRRNRRRTR